jgi:3D (Asp-Asp-Asp) domain-containing protein
VTTPKLARGSVSASKIADAAVTKAALATGSVTGSALAAGSVTSSALAAGSVTGTSLAPSAVSWKSLGAQVVAAAPVVLPVGTTSFVPATATASCPSGTVAISGGATVSDTTYGFVVQAFQGGPPGAAPTGWTATGATGGATASTMTVYVICISAGQ